MLIFNFIGIIVELGASIALQRGGASVTRPLLAKDNGLQYEKNWQSYLVS